MMIQNGKDMVNLTRACLKYTRSFEEKIMHKHLSELKHPQIGSIIGYENQIRIAVLKDEMKIWRELLESGDATSNNVHVYSNLESRVKELEKQEKVNMEERIERWQEEIKETSTENVTNKLGEIQ